MKRSMLAIAFASVFAFSSSPASSQDLGEVTIGQDEYLPEELIFDPEGTTYGTAVNSAEEIANTRFNFLDRHGREWALAANVINRRYQLYRADGSLAASGSLTWDQAYLFRTAAEQARRNHQSPKYDYLQPVPYWLIVEIGVAILIAWNFSSEEDHTGPQIVDQLDIMCRSDVARETATSLTLAQIHCPPESWVNSQGKLCRNRPELSLENPGMCRGVSYTGICTKHCE